MQNTRQKDNNIETIITNYIVHNVFDKTHIKTEIVIDKARQLKGIDIIVNTTKVDLKAQASPRYINNPTNTFILELSFLNKDGVEMDGWFINDNLETDMYAFIWIPSARVDNTGNITKEDDIKEIELMLVDKTSIKNDILSVYKKEELHHIVDYMRYNEERHYESKIQGIKFSHSPQLREKPVNIVATKEYLLRFAKGHFLVTKENFSQI